jgi:hypothetical protein
MLVDKKAEESWMDIEVCLRGAGCNHVLEQTALALPLPHSGEYERCTAAKRDVGRSGD